MSSFERLSLFMSGAALLLAIGVPIISFFWLDPQLQTFRRRAILQVNPIVESATGAGVDIAHVLTDKNYEIEIMNVGASPAKEVSLTLQYGEPITDQFDLTINPPFRTEASNKTNTKFVTLKEPIAPNDKIDVKFAPTPDTIWITNEFGERTILNTRAPFGKILKAAQAVQVYVNDQPILVTWDNENKNPNSKEAIELEAARKTQIETYRRLQAEIQSMEKRRALQKEP